MASSSLVYCQMCGAANPAADATCFACGHSLQHMASETEHLLLERYQILTQIGIGGFGAVYKARDTHAHGQLVAIKQINLRGLTPQESIEATDSFNREVQLLSNLSHPHLPHIHDHFTDPDHWYLVMDFIDGETLEHYLRDTQQTSIRALPFDEVLDIARQLCRVLDYLHTRQPSIIFRDLKPSNIMRTTRNRLVLIDFGIARYFKPGQSKDTIPLGSPGYAAPEQYGKAQTTPRADIYSLGALLHHLLSREDPAESPFSFAPLRFYGQTGLAELETLILRMVALDAEQRPASVQEVSAELDRISRLREEAEPRLWRPAPGQPLPNSPSFSQSNSVPWYPGSGQQQQQQQQVVANASTGTSRRKFITKSLVLGGLIVFGAAEVLPALHHRNEDPFVNQLPLQPPQAPIAIQVNSPQLVLTEHTSSVNAITWSPDGMWMASASDDKTVLVWNVSGQQVRYAYHGFSDSVKTVSWSSDGKYLAASSGRSLQIWDANTQQPIHPSPDITTGDAYDLAWSPSPADTRLAVARHNEAIQVLQVDNTGYVSQQFTLGSDSPQHQTRFAWSPDGSQIASQASSDVVKVWNTQTGDSNGIPYYLPPTWNSWTVSLAWSPDRNHIAANGETDTIRVWNVQDEGDGTDYSVPNQASVSMLSWSPDGRYLIAVTDNALYVWDLNQDNTSPISAYIYNSSPSFLTSVAWSPTNSFIASGSNDGSIQLWGASQPQPKPRHRKPYGFWGGGSR